MDAKQPENIQLEQVESSNISRVGFQPDTLDSGTLYIEFHHGGLYAYPGMNRKVYEEFRAAPSLGSFFQRNIRNKYPFTKIDQSQQQKASDPFDLQARLKETLDKPKAKAPKKKGKAPSKESKTPKHPQ